MTFWVFGYGSLLWNPGIDTCEQVVGVLPGWQRSFCMTSIHHRGTVEHPGLVLALDAQEGATCNGVAFRVTEGCEEVALAELRARELVSSAYLEAKLEVDLCDGRRVQALTYVINTEHEQYVHHSLEAQAQIISTAVGGRGPNTEYLYNTAAHLAEIGIEDTDLSWLAGRVRELTA